MTIVTKMSLMLESGDRLNRAEFHRRYCEHPEIKKAELIDGVVYAPSPLRHCLHGSPVFTLITLFGVYAAAHPGVTGSDSPTL